MGYVNLDEEGMGGLEYRYNGSVRGETGRAIIIADARGRSFNSIEQPASPGANLITTIDENIQYILEKEVAAAAPTIGAAASGTAAPSSRVCLNGCGGVLGGGASKPQVRRRPRRRSARAALR